MADNNVVEIFEQGDIDKNKTIAGLSYIPPLFFLPLVSCPDSRYARFHANQALLIILASIAISIVSFILGLIPVIGWLGLIVSGLGGIGVFVFFLMGIIGAFSGKSNPLPLIGSIKIIK